jgi:hypothetical protein
MTNEDSESNDESPPPKRSADILVGVVPLATDWPTRMSALRLCCGSAEASPYRHRVLREGYAIFLPAIRFWPGQFRASSFIRHSSLISRLQS